jgi:nitronate monooxygenase
MDPNDITIRPAMATASPTYPTRRAQTAILQCPLQLRRLVHARGCPMGMGVPVVPRGVTLPSIGDAIGYPAATAVGGIASASHRCGSHGGAESETAWRGASMRHVALQTAFTQLLGISAPVALAPMGGSAGGALAAAVSNGGGLGLLGGGHGEREWLERELDVLEERTDRPWGVGFLSWSVAPSTVGLALARRPHAVMLSFGDPRPFVRLVRDGGARLIIQVTDLDEARQALDVGADVIVAQGAEAGGHGGRRATLPFVPAVVDLVSPTPVLAAGGIADGRGIAAALSLGAAGALIGTRFQASAEALVHPSAAAAIVKGSGEGTERSRILDIARGAQWPSRYPARTLRNPYLDRWRGKEAELEADDNAKAEYRVAAARGDLSVIPVWASEAIDLITSVSPALALVAQLVGEAEDALGQAGKAVVPAESSTREAGD